MIYISKNNQVEITTDNIVNFIPDFLDVYFDDFFIGQFENLSTDKLIYLTFIVPSLDLEEREYQMKIYNHEALIKQELVIVKDFSNLEIKSINNTKEIKFYE